MQQGGSLTTEQRNRMEKNLPLAYHMAGKFAAGSFHSIPYEEILDCCIDGLINSALTYRPDHVSEATGRPVKFSSYAGVCMRNAVLMHVRSQRSQRRVVTFSELESHFDTEEHDAQTGIDFFLPDPVTEEPEEAESEIKTEQLEDALLKVIGSYRGLKRAVTIVYLANLTLGQRELAAIVGSSQSYLSRVLYRFRLDLAKALGGEAGEELVRLVEGRALNRHAVRLGRLATEFTPVSPELQRIMREAGERCGTVTPAV